MKRKARVESGLSDNEFSETSTPPEINKYVDISFAVARYIQNFVNSQDFKQKEVAAKLQKHESEISKWLNGYHNLTLKSIIKLETVCSIRLLNPDIFRRPDTSIEGMYNSPQETIPNTEVFLNNSTVWTKDLGDLSPVSPPVSSPAMAA